MYWYIYFMVLILVCLQMVSSQVSVSYTYVKDICPKQITLKCTYTGGTNCCSASTRLWFKNDIPILSDGASTPEGKYSEKDIKTSEKQFSLVINNFGKGDLNAEYKCSYALTTSTAYKLNDDPRYDEYCEGKCLECIAICLAYCSGGMIGVSLLVLTFLLCSSLLTSLPCHNQCSVSNNEGDSHHIFCGEDYVISKKKKSLLIAILVNAVGLILYGLIPGLCFGWFCYICYVELAPLLLLFALGALLFIVIFYWTLEFHSDENFSIWRYLGYVALTFLIFPLIVLVPYMCCKANSPKKEDSKELGTLNQ